MNPARTTQPAFRRNAFRIAVALSILAIGLAAQSVKTIDPTDVFRIKTCSRAEISPDGRWIVFTVSVPREAEETPGSSYSEIYVASFATGAARPPASGNGAFYSTIL